MTVRPFIVHADISGRENESQLLGSLYTGLALGWVDQDICFPQGFHDSVDHDVDLVFLQIITVDEDNIYVGGDKVIQEFVESVIDEGLKGCRGVDEAGGPHVPFIVVVASFECGFPFRSFCDTDMMVAPSEV